MKSVIGFSFVLLFVVSCGGGSGVTVSDIIEGFYAYLYGEYNQQNDDEMICNDPLFTRTEPFPAGLTTDFEILNPLIQLQNAQRGNPYLECEGSVERYYTDGTFVGRSTDSDLAQETHDFWSVCEVGTEPPNYGGHFGISEYEGDIIFCSRLDIIPGIVACRIIEPIVQGQELLGLRATGTLVIHQGVSEVVDFDEETCYLRHE